MKRLITTTIVLTVLLFVWGAIVRATGSGLGCPDWPLCHGQIIPPFEFPILMEWGHRLIASLVGFCTLGLTIVALVKEHYRRTIGGLAILSFFLLLVQALLGAAAVLGELQPAVVSVHLATGFIFLTMLLVMRLRSEGSRDNHCEILRCAQNDKLSFLLIATTLLVFAQSVLGSYVAASGAGLACPDFPLCRGEIFPPLVPGVLVQLLHRLGALLTVLAVGGVLMLSSLKKLSLAIGVVTLIQVLLGMGNIFYQMPTTLRVAHLAVATILYTLLVTTLMEVRRERAA